ncbi:armadillo-type protein [Lactarius quietus]|nr:armadillo-type protein [Lactarius quietus]
MRYGWLSAIAVLSAGPLCIIATPLQQRWGEMHVKSALKEVNPDWICLGPPAAKTMIDLHIVLQFQHENVLVDALYQVSTPSHPKYGAHLSKEQVAELVAPHPDTVNLVLLACAACAEQDIPVILHFILKMYKHPIVLNLSRYQQSAEGLMPWGRLLFQVVNLRIPEDAVPADEDEREHSEWWKAKKWAYGILGRLFHRFGNPSQLPSPLQEEYGAFAQHFVTSFAPEIFKVYLQQIELYVSGQAWLSQKCQYQILQFFTECHTKATFLPILGFVNTLLDAHPATPQCFGALNMLSALSPFAMRHPEVKHKMEGFMSQHIFKLPEFTAQEGYMWAVANKVVATEVCSYITWTSDGNVFRAVAEGLDDMELLKWSLRTNLLKLSDETDLDILNSSMETMVEHFQDELLPVAAQLTVRLCESYMGLVREAIASEENAPKGEDLEAFMEAEGDDDKTYMAMGVTKTLSTLISSIDSSPEILAQVQEVIIPVIRYTLESKVLDLFDNVYELVDSLTFTGKSHSISPNM